MGNCFAKSKPANLQLDKKGIARPEQRKQPALPLGGGPSKEPQKLIGTSDVGNGIMKPDVMQFSNEPLDFEIDPKQDAGKKREVQYEDPTFQIV